MEGEKLQIQIDNIKEDVQRLEIDRREDRKLLTDAIIEMKENNTKLTTILEYNNEKLNDINSEMSYLREDGSKKSSEQGLFDAHAGKIVILLIVIIASLLGIKLPI